MGTAAFLFVFIFPVSQVYADITSDGSLGTVVDKIGADFDISGGTQNGSNLFHSFGVFDINTGETATFQGPDSVARILGRVTGGSTSNIDGTLRSAIGGADLFLINPAGVVFGPNAVLDVQGSFHVSTADYLALGSDGRFDATTPGNSVLSTSPPSAFGFVRNEPAAISLNGSVLRVPEFQTLSVIGGDIDLNDATLFAKAGRVDLASVASSGEVVPSEAGLETGSFQRLGDINITHSTDIAGRPTGDFFSLPLANIDVSGDSAGDIYIRGGSFVADNGAVFSDTQGSGTAGRIDVAVREELRLANEARLVADAFFSGGAGSDIAIEAGSLVLENGGIILTVTTGSGDVGDIVINARDLVSLSGRSAGDDPRLQGNERSAIGSESLGTGAGGAIDIDTARLHLSDEGLLSVESLNAGAGGAVTINAESVSLSDKGGISLSTFRTANAGSLTINAADVSVTSGGVINSSSLGAGDAGVILINATGNVDVAGVAAPTDASDPLQQSQITSNAFAEGDGGSISINGDRLRVTDRGLIQANLENAPLVGQPPPAIDTRAGEIRIQVRQLEVSDGATVTSGNDSIGLGGNVQVDAAESIRLAGVGADGSQVSGLFSVAVNEGPSGTVRLTTPQLVMDDGATVNTSTIGAGDAGLIVVNADMVRLERGARISSSTGGSGAGGQVRVNATDTITASGAGSDGFGAGFYSDVQVPAGGQPEDAPGNGGNIDLTAGAMTLSDGATVSARSDGVGNAGTISIDAGASLEILNGGSVTTESVVSGGGRITVNARDIVYLLDSRITSSVADGTGNGGDITIDPEFVILDGSQIIAQAFAGAGGNISITAGYFLASPDSTVDASSQLGIDGQVNIDAPDTDISESLTSLPESFLDAAALLKQRCAARTSGSLSSFVVSGPGGVPPSPDGPLYASVAAPAVGQGDSRSGVDRVPGAPVMLTARLAGVPALVMGCGHETQSVPSR